MISVCLKRDCFFFFLNVCLIEQLYCYKFCMFICYACSVDFYSLVERGKNPTDSLVISNQQGYMYIKLIFSQSTVWSGNIFSSIAIFLIIALGTSGYFSIVMIFWLHILQNHYFFFLLHCIKFKCLFPLLTSYRSLLSNWFALAAQISLNRDS